MEGKHCNPSTSREYGQIRLEKKSFTYLYSRNGCVRSQLYPYARRRVESLGATRLVQALNIRVKEQQLGAKAEPKP